MQTTFGKIGTGLLRSLDLAAWCTIVGLTLYYTLVVLKPFYGQGIYLLSDAEIEYSTGVIFTQEEISAFDLWCLSIPVLLVLTVVGLLRWRRYSRNERWVRLVTMVAVCVPLALSLVSFGPLTAWLFE